MYFIVLRQTQDRFAHISRGGVETRPTSFFLFIQDINHNLVKIFDGIILIQLLVMKTSVVENLLWDSHCRDTCVYWNGDVHMCVCVFAHWMISGRNIRWSWRIVPGLEEARSWSNNHLQVTRYVHFFYSYLISVRPVHACFFSCRMWDG